LNENKYIENNAVESGCNKQYNFFSDLSLFVKRCFQYPDVHYIQT